MRKWNQNETRQPRTKKIVEDWSVSYRTEEGSWETTLQARSKGDALNQANDLIVEAVALRDEIAAHPGPSMESDYRKHLEEWLGEETP